MIVVVTPTKLASRNGLLENETIAEIAYFIHHQRVAFDFPYFRGALSNSKLVCRNPVQWVKPRMYRTRSLQFLRVSITGRERRRKSVALIGISTSLKRKMSRYATLAPHVLKIV